MHRGPIGMPVFGVLAVLVAGGLTACADQQVRNDVATLKVRVDSLESRLKTQYTYNDALKAVLAQWQASLSKLPGGHDTYPPPPIPTPKW